MTRRDLVGLVVGALVGLAVGGWLGLVAGTVLAAGTIWRRDGVLIAAMSAPVVMAIVTIVEADTDIGMTRVFPVLRPTAHQVGLVSALAWAAAGVVLWIEAGRSGVAETPLDAVRRPRWPLVILVPVAVLGTLMMID